MVASAAAMALLCTRLYLSAIEGGCGGAGSAPCGTGNDSTDCLAAGALLGPACLHGSTAL